MDPLVFEDLAPVEIPVRIGKEDYTLREASADAARQWRNAQIRSTLVSDGKVSGLGDLGDLESLLVSLCLFIPPDFRPVKVATVRAWPDRIVKTLYDKVMEMSPSLKEKPVRETLTKRLEETQKALAELDRKEESTKNSSGAGTDTSA